jgi:hypothetical protein
MKQRLLLCALLVGCGSGSSATGGIDGGAGGAAGSGDGGHDASTDRMIHADGAVATGAWGSPCWSSMDCKPGSGVFLVCVPPGQSVGGGACLMSQSPCANDAQCAAKTPNSICMPVQCTIPSDDGCRPGCMSAGCAPGFACGSNNRCTPKPCTPDVVCPVDETCETGLGCAHKGCTRDDQCSGACVSGSCYDRPGTCTPVPA